MRIVDVLNYRFPGVKHVGVWHVVHEQEKTIGTGGERFVNASYFGWVLTDVSGAGRDGAIHANAAVVRANPLAPAVALRGFDIGSVMAVQNIGERAQPEWARVALIDAPGFQFEIGDGIDDAGIVAEGHADPL